MSLRDEMSADLAGIAADLDNPTLDYLGTTYPCIPGGTGTENTLVVGGLEQNVDLLLRIRTADLGETVPATGKKLTYQETEYRILRVYRDAPGSHYNLAVQAVGT